MISQVDHLCKGRFMLGIGCGANNLMLNHIDMLDKDNHKIMLEVYDIINEIFEQQITCQNKHRKF